MTAYQMNASGYALSIAFLGDPCDCCAEKPLSETASVVCFHNTPHKLMPKVLLLPQPEEPATVSACRIKHTLRIYNKSDYLSIRATIVIIV